MFAQPSQHRNLLLLALLLLCCIYTATASFIPFTSADGKYHTLLLAKAHYAGFATVVICFVSYFPAPRFFRRTLGFTLILASVGLINFLPVAISIGINVGEAQIGLNPLFLLALAVFCFLNRSEARLFIRQYLLPLPTPKQAADRQRESIDQFKATFTRKNDDSLWQIVQERKMVADAVSAAQELLTERQNIPQPGAAPAQCNP